MNQKNLDKLITTALAIDAEDAKKADALGYMARAFVQASMPHSKPEGNEFIRKNGKYTLSIIAPSEIGLPYGSMPRLLLAWIATEAVRTKQRELKLGRSLTDFMEQLDLTATGGRWGSITRLKEQMRRLFSCSINCSLNDVQESAGLNSHIAQSYQLWWDPKNPEQSAMFESTLVLGESFFNEIVNYPVPIDMRALKGLKQSPMAIDIYCWLTYRMYNLERNTSIRWEGLQMQFGAGYESAPQGRRDFKKAFLRSLKKVHTVYPEAKLEWNENALLLKPSKTHISKKAPI